MGYVYIKPPVTWDRLKNPDGTVLVHEAYEKWPAGGIWASFADGHAKRMIDETEFKKLLEKSAP